MKIITLSITVLIITTLTFELIPLLFNTHSSIATVVMSGVVFVDVILVLLSLTLLKLLMRKK